MKNTWYPEITGESLENEKTEYLSYKKENPNSAVLKRFYDDFRFSFIYNTNAIEGNKISEYDTAHIISSGTFLEDYTAKDNMEVLGSNNAWNYVLTLPELSLDTIRQIHKHVLFFDAEHAGEFRKTPVRIGEKQMLPPEAVPEAMERLSGLFSEQNDIFAAIAEIHLKFENIHPFIDGNGRTGRMLMNLQLLQNGYLPINIKYSDAGKYYRCFREFDKSGEKGVQELYNLITKYAQEEMSALKKMVMENSHLPHDGNMDENGQKMNM